jgi:hypothetical protein
LGPSSPGFLKPEKVMPKRTIGALLKMKFATATREEMNDAYADKFGSAPSSNLTDDDVRTELVRAYGLAKATIDPPGTDQPAQTPIVTGVAKKTPIGAIPNLGPTGKWGGRTRLVTFFPMSDKQETQPLGLNGVTWYAPLNVQLEVPWGYWASAQGCKHWDTGSDAVTEWVKTKDGRLEKHCTPKAVETIRYTDHGDKPGTEDLPISYADFFQRKARETQMFSSFPRPVLTMIHDMLEIPRRNMDGSSVEPGMAFFRDMRDEDIRVKIAQTLGPEFEEMLQNQMWEAATA